MQSRNPIAMEGRALDTLKYIRKSMDSAGALAVPGSAGYLMGTVGLVAGMLVQSSSLTNYLVAIWLIAAAIALPLGAITVLRQSQRTGRALYSGPTRKFMLSLCPTLLAGAVFTELFVRHDLERYLPGTWLLLYGTAVLSASAITTTTTLKLLVAMGLSFMLLGAVAFESPSDLHNVILVAGFGGLHLLFGALIGWVNHGE